MLLWTGYRLAVCDLANRKPLVDLLVAPRTCRRDRNGDSVGVAPGITQWRTSSISNPRRRARL